MFLTSAQVFLLKTFAILKNISFLKCLYRVARNLTCTSTVYSSHKEVRWKPTNICWLKFKIILCFHRYVAICHPFLVQRSRSSAQRSTLGGFERHASRTGSKLISFRGGGGNASSVSQQHNSSGMLKKRTCHYLLPALIFSVLINIPKFFEFRTVDRWVGRLSIMNHFIRLKTIELSLHSILYLTTIYNPFAWDKILS